MPSNKSNRDDANLSAFLNLPSLPLCCASEDDCRIDKLKHNEDKKNNNKNKFNNSNNSWNDNISPENNRQQNLYFHLIC